MKPLLFFFFSLFTISVFGQNKGSGFLTGMVIDEKGRAMEGASLELTLKNDSSVRQRAQSDKSGSFVLQVPDFGYYGLRVSFIGFQPVLIDSIHFRKDRSHFNLNEIGLAPQGSANLKEVIIYAEKPLIQSKDGNLTFNAAESALSAGSNAGDLLTNVPLISKDPAGKLLVRGKEPRILIDDKPVELNPQQLQDLLESLPGSAIEKIEVMTNPPPPYANEQGGVINITTRKGRVGKSGRLHLSAGSRGEGSTSGNFNYRKDGLVLNINAGTNYNVYNSVGFTNRKNLYGDSIRFFNTNDQFNRNHRPNIRISTDYDINKSNAVNLTLGLNGNDFDNATEAEYQRYTRREKLYYISKREVASKGSNYSGNLSVSYTRKAKKPGETLKFIGTANRSRNDNARNFYEAFFNPADYSFNGTDSAQQVLLDNLTSGYTARVDYNKTLDNKKTTLSTGAFYNGTVSAIASDATYKRKGSEDWLPLAALTNSFGFTQHVTNLRVSVRQLLKKNLSATAGLSAERTGIQFDLFQRGGTPGNSYWSWLPFGNINKAWKENVNLTFSYRRTIRRPGMAELNPTIDSSDQYNVRFGNPALKPSLTHNLDLVLGKTNKSFYVNLGLGFNRVADVFNQLRVTPTEITWQNSKGKKEYEISTWSGYTLSKNARVNVSASYTYNQFSTVDKVVRRFRDGGSFASSLNGNYSWKDLYTATGSFTFNRFASPQGAVRSNLSMNLGIGAKMLDKRLTLTLNLIDPLRQQQNRSFIYGSNFSIENFNTTRTRNFRVSLSYNLVKTTPVKKGVQSKKAPLQKAVQTGKA